MSLCGNFQPGYFHNGGIVTFLPSLIIFAQILSKAIPLISVSLSMQSSVSPSGYSASFTKHGALVWKYSKLMEPWNSCLSLTTAIKVLRFGNYVLFKQFKIPVYVIPISIIDP